MLNLARDVKDVKRFRRILSILVDEGLGYYVIKSKLHSSLPWKHKLKLALSKKNNQQLALYLRQAFERLGPTFVKFGQLLSLRPDLVPKEFSEEFTKLQDHVPSFPYSQAKKIIEEDFKKDINKIFKTFEKKPFASASMAQVHLATLKSGEKVAVKILRPDIKEIIDADLDILFFIAKSLEKHFPETVPFQPTEVVKEFALWTRRELNFQIEAHNALILKDEMKDNPNVKIPKIYLDYSSKRVLTMELIKGVKLDDLEALKKLKVSRKKLSQVYFFSILEQALLHGLFHADPHPANLFVQKNGQLVYLDFGIMGELTPSDRKRVMQFILSLPDKDPEKSLKIILSLAREIKSDDIAQFRKETLQILQDVYYNPIGKRSIGKALYEIISLGAKNGVIFDPSHILMAKAVYQAEGLGLKLDPEFKVADGFSSFADKYLKMNFSPGKLISKAKKTIMTQKDLLMELPDHVIKIIERLEAPPHEHTTEIESLQKEIKILSDKKNTGFILTILSVATLFFFYAEGKTDFFGFRLSTIILVITIIVGLYTFYHRRREI